MDALVIVVAMSVVGWVVVVLVALPTLGLLLFLLVVNSRVVIRPGRLGLLLVRGRATDVVLRPGPHWVASLRRRQLVEYPSVELAYRAGDTGTPTAGHEGRDVLLERGGPPLERAGPSLPVVLGDRATAVVRYTVRFCVDPEQLRSLHERVGPEGLWSVVRDTSEREVALALVDAGGGVDEVFGGARAELARRLAVVLSTALQAEGLLLKGFHLVEVDLAGTGATIQDTVRARYDAELAAAVADLPIDAVRRYQEVELWRRVAARDQGVSVVLPLGNGSQHERRPDGTTGGGRP